VVETPGPAPLFTVLMPTFNGAETIGPAIDSVLLQSFEDFELLVVGDGCTDITAEIVNGYNDKRIRWFDYPKGPGFGYENRNRALAQARGNLFAFAAHDDLHFPNHLAVMAERFSNPVIQWAYSRPAWVRDDGLIVPFFGNIRAPSEGQRFKHRNFIPASCAVFRRELHERSGGWPADVAEAGDWTMWHRMFAGLAPDALCVVRVVTNLHFKASWRDPAKWAPQPLPYLSALADSSNIWPAVLKLNISPTAATPQEQVLEKIKAEPQAFAQRINAGVQLLQDEISWSAVLTPPFHRQT